MNFRGKQFLRPAGIHNKSDKNSKLMKDMLSLILIFPKKNDYKLEMN